MTIFKMLEQSGWSVRAGDPDVMSWTIFTGYVVVSSLCLYAGIVRRRIEFRSEAQSEPVMWFLVSLFLFLLAVNKQLDLQVLMTASGRALAHMQGWYSVRRKVQMVFFSVFAISGVWLLWFGLRRFRIYLRENILLCAGLGLIATFILISAAYDTNVWRIPESLRFFSGARMKNIVEFGGILLVGVSALRAIRYKRHHTQDHSER
jgi:hypothetical protein